jgi:hypothetical protein
MHIRDYDKYSKSSVKAVLPSSQRKYDDGNQIKVPTHLLVFACFVLASFVALAQIGVYGFNTIDSERFVVLQVEILGLVMLRQKIKDMKSVGGISGTTFVMYALVYLFRTIDGFSYIAPWDPEFRVSNLGLDPVLGFCSSLLVLDILKSIFVTLNETYDAPLEVLKAWYLIPMCLTLASVLHVSFPEFSFTHQLLWNCTLYMDVLALMPQVAMMAMSGGKVATPVANFVAATAISRCGDVTHTMMLVHQEFMTVKAADPDVEFSLAQLNGSTWLVVGSQFIHLLLVADFMYYYCKTRTWADDKSDEIAFLV